MPSPRPDRIVAHHVGGRDGGGGFRASRAFAADFVHVVHEPATDAHGDIARALQSYGGEGHILPYALADAGGEATFHVNFDPYTSSLLPWAGPHPFGEGAVVQVGGLDYTAEFVRTVEERSIGVARLDALIEIADGRVPPPDVLTLDTQGSELAIIRGASGVLAGTVAIRTEVLFAELYRGQAPFGAVQAHLAAAGFTFIRFENLNGFELGHFPLGLRGEETHAQADALFLRPPAFFAPDDPQLVKLAFVAHVLGQHAIGFGAMQRFAPAPATPGDEPVYRRFLRELRVAQEAMPAIFPATYLELYPDLEASFLRFDASRGEEMTRHRERVLAPIRQRIIARQHDVIMLANAESTPVEDVFRAYGLEARAGRLAERRKSDVAAMLNAVNLAMTTPL